MTTTKEHVQVQQNSCWLSAPAALLLPKGWTTMMRWTWKWKRTLEPVLVELVALVALVALEMLVVLAVLMILLALVVLVAALFSNR